MWRKNRADNQQIFGLCRGVDLNRNFGFKWAHKVAFVFDSVYTVSIHFS